MPTLPPDLVATLRAAGCVFAEDEAALLVDAARDADELAAMAQRRVAGQPIEHIIGWAEFCGLRIAVGPGVFVPRHRTEFLVREAAARAEPGDVVVDLCCGAGAVAAALLAAIPTLVMHAADLDPAAVRSARVNLGDRAAVHEGDLYSALPTGLAGRVDVLVANTPYVPTEAIAMMPPEARLHEARVALDGGADGLDVQRRLAAGAPHWLSPGGHVLVEASERQAPVTAEIFAQHGLLAQITCSDELDATVVVGERPT